jgi:hypothetical protein
MSILTITECCSYNGLEEITIIYVMNVQTCLPVCKSELLLRFMADTFQLVAMASIEGTNGIPLAQSS